MLQADQIAAALTKVFRPMVRMLLRLGVPLRAAADALRWTYVDVATHEFAMEDNRQSKSRVAVITGLSRTEVERLQREPAIDPDRNRSTLNRASRVLSAWQRECRYTDSKGKPKVLSLDGELSFQSLVEDFSGGATMRSVLDELVNKQAVRIDEDRRVHVLTGNLLVTSDASEQLNLMSVTSSDLIETMERNFRLTDDRYLQAYIDQEGVPFDRLPELRTWIRQQSGVFMDAFEAEVRRLAADASIPRSADHRCERLGMGLYYFQSPPPRAAIQLDNRGLKRKPRVSSSAKRGRQK